MNAAASAYHAYMNQSSSSGGGGGGGGGSEKSMMDDSKMINFDDMNENSMSNMSNSKKKQRVSEPFCCFQMQHVGIHPLYMYIYFCVKGSVRPQTCGKNEARQNEPLAQQAQLTHTRGLSQTSTIIYCVITYWHT